MKLFLLLCYRLFLSIICENEAQSCGSLQADLKDFAEEVALHMCKNQILAAVR